MLAVQVQYLQYAENRRHNLAYEDETKRHNVVTEQIASDTLHETQRSNLVHETQEWTKIEQQQQQINENIRHNKASENISLISANAQAMNAQTNRMLANAQIPLIHAQTDFERQKAATESYNTDIAYSQSKIARSNSFWADALNFGKVVNEIVPF